MSIRDGWAAAFVALAVVAFLAIDNTRWAAATVGLLGMAACSLGRRSTGTAAMLLSVLGVATLAALVVALLTASRAALALLVLGDVVLWVVSTLRHTGARTPTHVH